MDTVTTSYSYKKRRT